MMLVEEMLANNGILPSLRDLLCIDWKCWVWRVELREAKEEPIKADVSIVRLHRTISSRVLDEIIQELRNAILGIDKCGGGVFVVAW
jgi:hypothetical protein